MVTMSWSSGILKVELPKNPAHFSMSNRNQIQTIKRYMRYRPCSTVKLYLNPPPHQKREIPQCTNCQRYGHTKSFCHRKPKCVKCSRDHATINWHRKGRSDDVKCVLCGDSHPANYKDCTIYKSLQRNMYPTLRKNCLFWTKEHLQQGFHHPK